jgi:HK97 family phage prohead protease/HK97 family phage major capsid protein
MTEMEIRSFEVRLDAETREVIGLAVPYGSTANIGGVYEEAFAPGAIRSVEDVKLFWQHSEPIGKILEGRDTEAGFEIRAKISDIPRGNEAYTLLRDGVINKFSVAFVPVEQTRDGNLVTRTLVDLKEVSLVSFPAFAGANVSEVREEITVIDLVADSIQTKETNIMSENMELDVRAVQDEVAEIRRELELVKAPTISVPSFEQKFRSQGEYAKALVTGDSDAIELFRAATSADAALRPAFVGFVNSLINSGRPTLNAFSVNALPSTGLTIEYAKVNTNTIAVGKQTTENTALSEGAVALSTVSVAVNTYGGFTKISKQAIERSTVNYLDVAFQAMSLAYAKKMNTEFVAVLAALTWTGKTYDISALTAAAVMGGIADGAAYIYNATGLSPEFIVAGVTAYKRLVSIVDTAGRPVVQQVGTGDNIIGLANIPGLKGSILGLPIVVDPALEAKTAYLASSQALTTYESAGTPTRLSVSDPTTLTDTYSVYGYAAFAVPFEGAIVKLNTGA